MRNSDLYVQEGFEKAIESIKETKEFLLRLSYNESYIHIYNKLVIDMLLKSCTFIESNLTLLLHAIE